MKQGHRSLQRHTPTPLTHQETGEMKTANYQTPLITKSAGRKIIKQTKNSVDSSEISQVGKIQGGISSDLAKAIP